MLFLFYKNNALIENTFNKFNKNIQAVLNVPKTNF